MKLGIYSIMKVGYLIGHYGRTIWGFERTTGAKIDILRPNSHDYETPVAISGSAEGVRHVLRRVEIVGGKRFC